SASRARGCALRRFKFSLSDAARRARLRASPFARCSSGFMPDSLVNWIERACRLIGPWARRSKPGGALFSSFGLLDQARRGGASLAGDFGAGQHAGDLLLPLGKAQARNAGRHPFAGADVAL